MNLGGGECSVTAARGHAAIIPSGFADDAEQAHLGAQHGAAIPDAQCAAVGLLHPLRKLCTMQLWHQIPHARATHRALCSLFASPPSWRALTLPQRGQRPGQAQARQAAKCLQSCAAASATCARGPPRQHRTGWKGQAIQLAHNAEVAQRAAAPGRHRPVQPRCRQAHHACHDNLIRGRLHAPCKGCSASQPQLERILRAHRGAGLITGASAAAPDSACRVFLCMHISSDMRFMPLQCCNS